MFKSSNLFLGGTSSPNESRRPTTGAIVWRVVREHMVRLSAGSAIARERKALRNLTETELSDMGITRAQADEEASRDYFDIPSERLTMYGLLDCGTEERKTRQER